MIGDGRLESILLIIYYCRSEIGLSRLIPRTKGHTKATDIRLISASISVIEAMIKPSLWAVD